MASFFAEAGATYSLGASGAVFGLFAVAVLLKLRFNLKKLVECVVLGQFVVKQVLQVMQVRHFSAVNDVHGVYEGTCVTKV